MTSYTKLFSSIVTSTIWCAPHPTRVVWITMLAMADKNGEVAATVPGLARMANVTIEECDAALAAFMAPDPHSRTPDEDGRRIEPIEGGWALINHAKYRAMASRDEQKTAAALRQQRYRQRNARNGSSVTRDENVTPSNATVTQTLHIADTEAEAEADTTNKYPPSPPRGKRAAESKPKAERERNPLYDALAEATDGPPAQLTKATARAVGVALADIRRVCPDLTPDEIRRRADNYRSHFRDAALTASALGKHWARCDKPIASATKSQWQPDRNADPDAW